MTNESAPSMEIGRFRTLPDACSYIPGELSCFDYRMVMGQTGAEYEALLQRGWRRFGSQYFRPACPLCSQCKSLRVDVNTFTPSRSQRRTRKANQDLTVWVRRPSMTQDHLDLYDRYHADMHERRGWKDKRASKRDYAFSFIDGDTEFAREFLYFEDDKLIGVALVDLLPNAASAVYFFHEPTLRSRALGVYSVLYQIEYCKQNRLDHLYLGYWINQCQSMAYKTQYRPHQKLSDFVGDDEEPIWTPVPTESLDS